MKLYELFQEDNGNLSSTRLAFLLWTVGVLVVWSISSLRCTTGLAELPESIWIIIGLLMSGKVVQKFGEKPNSQMMPTEDKGA
jgi:hypothetical protein